ncbi:MAG TPA: hypothetical protein VGN11_03915 [Candidatus Baltobacteraceae bacterium]|jgi:hypothetical protein|nr:hypothetical protein [Candidatus Baltobacteraceae bacterium]
MASRWLSALGCAAILLSSALPAFAADSMKSSNLDMNAPSRFSGPGVYNGPPALPVTLSMVIAGGGPSNFSTLTLVHTLAGDKTAAEVASLKKKFGDTKVTNFVKVFDYVVSDTLAIVKDKKIALPSTPSPDPKDGKALSAALWGAGETPRGFDVEVMLDRAVSHPIHVQVMDDIDKKFGIGPDADYHAVLTQAMKDLASVYGLKSSM